MKPGKSFLQQRLGLAALGASVPSIQVRLGRADVAGADYTLHLPFQRSIRLILIASVFLLLFCLPLFTMGDFLSGGDDDSLFSLVFVLFTVFWLLGWSVGIGLLLLVVLGLMFGRETLQLAGDKLILRIGIPGLSIAVTYSAEFIRNFRMQHSDGVAARSWRGEHLSFDYAGVEIGFGSAIEGARGEEILARLRAHFPLESAPPIESVSTAASMSAAVKEEAVSELQSESKSEVAMPVQRERPRWYSLSALALIAANLIPLAGVLLVDWSVGEIMLLYWAESAIVGYYNLCKMRKVGGWALLFYGPFFVAHYGAFMAVHLLFIYALFSGDAGFEGDVSSLQVFDDLLALWPALLGLLVSHGISYYHNFIKAERYHGRSMRFQMGEPYRRIIIMHVTIIFGGFVSLSLGDSLGALLLLLGMKIAVDLRAHLSQHAS